MAAMIYLLSDQYPSLVNLYETLMLVRMDYRPVGGCVAVPAAYAPWAQDLEQAASHLSAEGPPPESFEAAVLTATRRGLQELTPLQLLEAQPELLQELADLGPQVARLAAFVRHIGAHFSGPVEQELFARTAQ